jgi:cation-transporting ATPase I
MRGRAHHDCAGACSCHELPMGLVKWTRGVRDLFVGDRERSVSLIGERAYVQYRGVSPQDLPSFLAAVSERARAHVQIRAVHLNPFTRRVVFQIDGGGVARSLLVALVTSAEAAVLANPNALELDSERDLPDDLSLDREYSVEALADALALLSSVVLRIVPFMPRRLGTNLHGLLFVISQVDSLRRPLDERFGRERTDFLLNIAQAFTQGIAQRPLSALIDLGAKVASLRELRARRALWQRWGDQLVSLDTPDVQLAAAPARPVEAPSGPIERYSDRAWAVALGSFGVSLVTTRNVSRAVAAGFAALPQPARLGRELFVAELGRLFARHGMLALSKDALRRLDRIDCLVLPAEIVAREQFLIGDAFALRDVSREDALLQARLLFSADRPLRVQRGDEFTLGPMRLLPHPLDDELAAASAEREERGVLVLALARGQRVVGLIEVQIFPERGVADALSAARKLGLSIVVAADSSDAAESVHPDDVIGLSSGLVEGIQRLQREGRSVCFFGRGPSPAYAAADLGVALCPHGSATPWGAHLLCPDDTHTLSILVESMAVARGVSEQSVRLAMGAAAFGTLASTSGLASFAARRVMFVVNAASLAAMIDAARRTALVERSTRPLLDPTPWHALSAAGVLARLGSSETGLAVPDPDKLAASRRPTPAWVELGRAVQKELMSPLSPLLALGAGVSAMVGSMADASIVAGVGGINALIGGYQRFRTERAITQLVQVADTRVHVRRAGLIHVCAVSDLRRGDVVVLGQGDVVPADCRILSAESLEVDTSALTGESLPVQKSSAPSFADSIADVTSMLHAGTSIAAGRASAVVVAIGDDTVAQRAVLQMPDESRGGVEARLRELMRLTGPVALAAGAALVAAGLLRGRRVDDLVSTGVGLAVAAVPEGLPVLATAAQLAAAERLSRRGALVKNPRAIEAVGRVDVLCMDKTGTLTEGHIELFSVHDGELDEPLSKLGGPRREVLSALAAAVSHARGGAVDPMDAAIVRAAREALGSDYDAGVVRLAERAFESSRGFEAALLRTPDGVRMLVKGAPEQLLARSDRVARGAEQEPQPQHESRLLQVIEGLAGRGLRVLAVAERAVSEAELESDTPHALLADPRGLCLRGFVSFRDPARPSARPAIEGLARAGVRVVMITGDHASTAHAIAQEVGLPGAGHVLSGAQIAQLGELELEQAATHTSVFARVTPAQKVRVVRALQRAGHVVGMVGDGANDAPAMRIADAGIAVGKDCTEAARNASDLVLADARIDSLVDVVVEGRAMWTAVRDAVSILVGGNLGEIGFTVAIGALTGGSPLSPRQLLLVNFLTDIAPSMAIALRPPSVRDLAVLREATPQTALGAALDREIVSRAIATGMGAGTAWLAARVTGGSVRARTVGLVGLVGSQLGQTLLKGGQSKSVVWTSIGSFAALGLIVQTPGLSQLFGCRPLGPLGWTTGIVSSAGVTLLSPAIESVVDRVADLAQVLRARAEELAHRTETGRAEAAVRALASSGVRLFPR